MGVRLLTDVWPGSEPQLLSTVEHLPSHFGSPEFEMEGCMVNYLFTMSYGKVPRIANKCG